MTSPIGIPQQSQVEASLVQLKQNQPELERPWEIFRKES